MQDVVIREAVEADIPALVRLLADDELGRARETPDDLAPYYAAFAVISADPHQMLMVLERVGAVAGTLQLTFLPGLSHRGTSRAMVEAVRIADSQRGAGLGAVFMGWAEEQARAWGCGVLQLTSNKTRPDAHRFYARLGYEATHEGFKKPLPL